MNFEWDNTKATSNYAKHRVTFEYATRVFLDERAVQFEVNHAAHREKRHYVLGVIEARVYVVVFTLRNSNRRIISARKANTREQKKYHAFHA